MSIQDAPTTSNHLQPSPTISNHLQPPPTATHGWYSCVGLAFVLICLDMSDFTGRPRQLCPYFLVITSDYLQLPPTTVGQTSLGKVLMNDSAWKSDVIKSFSGGLLNFHLQPSSTITINHLQPTPTTTINHQPPPTISIGGGGLELRMTV